MKVLSAEEMQACDRVTTERYGVPSIELMRAAASAADVFAREAFPRARRVTVLCGKGNNGGDGMMAARLLAKAGLEVTTLLLGSQYELKGDAATAWRELSVSPNKYLYEVNSAAELRAHNAALEADLIIDAVLGTGFKPPMKGLALAAMEWASESAAPFLSVDLPSGWQADATSSSVDDENFPVGCSDHVYGAQGGACFRRDDTTMESTDCGGSNRFTGGGDCFRTAADLGGEFACAGGAAATGGFK